MKPLVGLLYIATGLLCDFVFALFVGAMLGVSAPTYRLSELLFPALYVLGPSLLILSGVATLIPSSHRALLCIGASVILLLAAATWSVPNIGWRDATWLLLEPALVSLVLATIALLLLRKAWFGALVGTILCTPFFVYGATSAVQDFFASSPQLWVVGPSVLLVLCILSSLCFRRD
jgi:hypothetical protein